MTITKVHNKSPKKKETIWHISDMITKPGTTITVRTGLILGITHTHIHTHIHTYLNTHREKQWLTNIEKLRKLPWIKMIVLSWDGHIYKFCGEICITFHYEKEQEIEYKKQHRHSKHRYTAKERKARMEWSEYVRQTKWWWWWWPIY